MPVLKDHITGRRWPIFPCGWTCYQRSPVLRDQHFYGQWGGCSRPVLKVLIAKPANSCGIEKHLQVSVSKYIFLNIMMHTVCIYHIDNIFCSKKFHCMLWTHSVLLWEWPPWVHIRPVLARHAIEGERLGGCKHCWQREHVARETATVVVVPWFPIFLLRRGIPGFITCCTIYGTSNC